MELQREPVPPEGERLVRRARCCGEVFGALRQVERVAMPMQHRHACERRQRRAHSGLAQFHRRPADLLEARLIDARTRRARHELRAKANPQHRAALGKAPRDERDLGAKKGIVALLIDADRPAEHDEKIGRAEFGRGEIVHRGAAIRHLVAARRERCGERIEILERDMAQRDGALHAAEITADLINAKLRSVSAVMRGLVLRIHVFTARVPNALAKGSAQGKIANPRSSQNGNSIRPHLSGIG